MRVFLLDVLLFFIYIASAVYEQGRLEFENGNFRVMWWIFL